LEQADGTTISIVGEPFKGNGRARVVLIEFSDFECSYCGRYFADAYAQIDAAYIKTGKIKYVFRDFPLERIHPNAFTAAEAANCANEQGKFWAMHDRLYANQQSLAESDLSTHAQAVGLNAARFDACLTTDKYAAEIRRDMAEGAAVGITGTPAFLIALAVPNNPKVKIIKTLSGSLPFDDFKAAIDEALGMKR
jgi:protein-disulfide isomerase